MISGMIPCSFIDYPGELSCVLFTQGCNLRCRYCHNPELCRPVGPSGVSMEEVEQFLAARKGKLTAVTVTGGEPTLHGKLFELLLLCRKLGFLVKLDTNGTRPLFVRDLARSGLLTYVAVDVKIAPGDDSSWLTGTADQGARALETLARVVEAGVACEARTTVLRPHHDLIRLAHTARCLSAAGVRTWRIQPVEAGNVLDGSVPLEPPSDAVLSLVVERASRLGIDAAVRPRQAPMTSLTIHQRKVIQ